MTHAEAEGPQPPVTLDIDERVASITLNRPDKLNALNSELLAELVDILRRINEMHDVRVVVLRGAGRAFSAGADIAEIDTLYKDPVRSRRFLTLLRDAGLGLERLRQPVVAAVHGMVLAGGLEIMLACDLVIAEESTRIGDQHINWGFIPGGGSTQRLPRLVGAARARDLLYTGRWLSAAEALQIGLAARVVPDGTLATAAQSFVAELARRGGEALARIKSLVRHAEQMPLEQGLALEIETVMWYYAHPDFVQGLDAFKNRRPPEFS
jgi:enoyl-CoA hydratase/carnithine racemase